MRVVGIPSASEARSGKGFRGYGWIGEPQSHELLVRATEQSKEGLMIVYEAMTSTVVHLYVGVTGNLENRMMAHRMGPWFRSMAYLRLTVFADRKDAYSFETQRIKETQAMFNLAMTERDKRFRKMERD